MPYVQICIRSRAPSSWSALKAWRSWCRNLNATSAATSSPCPKRRWILSIEGCRRLLSHLKEMASGSPPVPLRFIPEYLALGKLRNAKYGPADLFSRTCPGDRRVQGCCTARTVTDAGISASAAS